MDKLEVQEFYKVLKENCGNDTQTIIQCLNRMHKDGIIEHLKDMEGLTEFESQYIIQLIDSK